MRLPGYPKITLEQWRTLLAVVDSGGYAAAAESLNKSQSTVTYAIKKLERTLAVPVFERSGRKAVLTATGSQLLARARVLLEEAARLEAMASRASAGWESELGICAEVLFPTWLMLDCLAAFGEHSPHTHIELIEAVMGGAQEALLTGAADLAICNSVPQGFAGDPLLTLRFLPVAHPDHPLHGLGRPLSLRDLRRHRHIVVRETGSQRLHKLSVQAEQRWTVGNMATSIGAVCRGYAFAWFPEEKIRSELAAGELKVLPMESGKERLVTLYLVTADPDGAGPGLRCLTDLLREGVATHLHRHGASMA